MSDCRMTNFTTIARGSILVTQQLRLDSRLDQPLNAFVSFANTAGAQMQAIECGSGALKIAVSQCGKWLARADQRGLVTVLPVEEQDRTKLQIHSNMGPCEIGWSPNSRVLLLKGEQRCSLYDRDSQGLIASIPIEPRCHVAMPCEAECFMVCTGGTYGLFDWQTATKVRDLRIDPQARLVELSTNLKFVAYLVDSKVSLYDIELETVVWSNEFDVPSSVKGAICFSPDSKTLLILSANEQHSQTVSLVDTVEFQESCFNMPNTFFAGLQFADEESIWLWNVSESISRWTMLPESRPFSLITSSTITFQK